MVRLYKDKIKMCDELKRFLDLTKNAHDQQIIYVKTNRLFGTTIFQKTDDANNIKCFENKTNTTITFTTSRRFLFFKPHPVYLLLNNQKKLQTGENEWITEFVNDFIFFHNCRAKYSCHTFAALLRKKENHQRNKITNKYL